MFFSLSLSLSLSLFPLPDCCNIIIEKANKTRAIDLTTPHDAAAAASHGCPMSYSPRHFIFWLNRFFGEPILGCYLSFIDKNLYLKT
jgi:hypothetical protein